MDYLLIGVITGIVLIVQCVLLYIFKKWNKRSYIIPLLYFVIMIALEFYYNGIFLVNDYMVYNAEESVQGWPVYDMYSKVDYAETITPLVYTALIVIVPLLCTIIVNIIRRVKRKKNEV